MAAARTPADLAHLVELRVAGMPLEHVLGWAEFCGVRICVDTGVFVPRRRTELLVREAAPLAGRGAVVVDLCCGSGAVGAVLAARRSAVELHAVDIDPAAVRCALRNVLAPGAVHEGDLFEPLPDRLRGRVDVIVANAPYVPTDALGFMPREAQAHEPAVALDGGVDGLEVQRRVIAEAPDWLVPGGHLLVETGEPQASSTAEVFALAGLVPRVVRCGELDATVVVGRR